MGHCEHWTADRVVAVAINDGHVRIPSDHCSLAQPPCAAAATASKFGRGVPGRKCGEHDNTLRIVRRYSATRAGQPGCRKQSYRDYGGHDEHSQQIRLLVFSQHATTCHHHLRRLDRDAAQPECGRILSAQLHQLACVFDGSELSAVRVRSRVCRASVQHPCWPSQANIRHAREPAKLPGHHRGRQGLCESDRQASWHRYHDDALHSGRGGAD